MPRPVAVTLAMALSMPLTALAIDAKDQKLALRCTESLFFKGLDGVLEGYPGIAYPPLGSRARGFIAMSLDMTYPKLSEAKTNCAPITMTLCAHLK